MPEITQAVRDEITRLQNRRCDLIAEVSRTDQLLSAATHHLAVLEPTGDVPAPPPAIATDVAGEPTGQASPRVSAASSDPQERTWGFPDLTMEDVEAAEIPQALNGHRLHPQSKKGRVIKGITAILKQRSMASRDEMVRLLSNIGIVGHERDPEATLSVILSEARELFDSDRFWFFREDNDEVEMEE